MNDKIIWKYIELLSLVAKYTKSRWGKKILIKDLFVCLLDLFRKNRKIKIHLGAFGLVLDKMIKLYEKDYDLDGIDLFENGVYSFVLSKKTINLLESLDEIWDTKLFSLNLFLDLLFHEDILPTLMNDSHLAAILENFPIKDFFNSIYEDKKTVKEFANIFKLYNINEKDTITKDDYSDMEIDDEEDYDETDEPLVINWKKSKMIIDTFATNLTLMAKNWKLEPVVWREKELNEVIYTLLRKNKSNPLLIWEAWVGKTAIVEWLAQKIAKWDVPEKLKWKQIYNLDMWSLVAGTKFRWEFEARLKNIIKEATDPNSNIILFIDEIHTMIGTWNQEWSWDTANLIKPYLARGELTVIWATTFNEYKKYIEKDPALTRRFQVVKVDEPSEEEAIKLIEWVKHRFEDFHGVNIDSSAIEEAVKLSKRYILDRYLPDKAFDLIDESSSRKSSVSMTKEKEKNIEKLNKKIKKIEKKIEKAVQEQDYFAAADYKEEVKKLKDEIKNLYSKSDIPKNRRPVVTKEDIQNVIAEKYGVSTSILSKSELEFLKSLKDKLKEKIIWQDNAVDEVVNAIIRNKISPIEKTKPIWSFLFLWPSGVWKTYLAQLLAEEFFQNKDALIKINMSEYWQDVSVNKLTWSAPWYVWYEEGWQLTEAVRKRPYSVVLFDEIEKGSPAILNLLLQILDQWYLEDNKWRKIDFKNTIIILTSNIWAEYFWKEVTKVGFSLEKNTDGQINDEKKDFILQEVKNLLPIELINRFDKIIFFNKIDKNLLTEIFKKYYKEYKQQWKDKKWINIPTINKEQIEEIISKIYKEWSGVRWIEKYIHNDLETKIIQDLIK